MNMLYIETDKVEFKEKINDTLTKEIESFLNTNGGAIYIGIDDNGKIVGVDNTDETLRKISDIISDQIEPNAIDCVRPEVEFKGDKIVIKINVSKGYSPLYCIKKYGFSPNGCHYRIGTTCKSMTLEMIRNKFEQGLSNIDAMVLQESYNQDLKFVKLKLLLLENGYHIDDKTFEKNFKLQTTSGSYNYLAELLADDNSIPFIFVKFKGYDKAVFSERKDYGNQCIILAYEKMKERLSIENICKTITDPRPRCDIYLFDMDAVNEALVNAIVHNDYRISDPQVALFYDRLEIISHGGLPYGLTKEEFFKGISKPRNKQLMDIFSRLGIVEHTGHGIPKIVEKYGQEVFEISASYIKVTIPFNKEVMEFNNMPYGVINDISKDIIESQYLAGFDDKESIVLSQIRQNPKITTKQISINTGIPFRTVQRHIANLRDKNIIVRKGSNRDGYWNITKGI